MRIPRQCEGGWPALFLVYPTNRLITLSSVNSSSTWSWTCWGAACRL